MRSTTRIIVFARAPVAGEAKTRLIPALGAEGAARLHARLVELGWPALAVPERAGGVGAKMVGIAALVEEIGRVALPSPLLSTFAAAFVLREAGTSSADGTLARIAEGTRATTAFMDRHGSEDPARTEVRARAEGTAYRLSGTASFVQDAKERRIPAFRRAVESPAASRDWEHDPWRSVESNDLPLRSVHDTC